MLLTEITLFNFRQFKGKQTITFSGDADRNVTVIIGENGSGKTTLAQALHGAYTEKQILKISP